MNNRDIPNSFDDPFKQLKHLLLTEDQNRIQQLEAEIQRLHEQLNEKDHLIETLQPVIAELLENKIRNSKAEMAESLAPVMSEAIKVQIRDAKEDMVDAMYPIVGRMVSKAVTEAMKKFAANINQQLNKTFNFSRWFRSLIARFKGVSQAELIMRDALPFEIQRVFLIAKNSGLLVSYANREGLSPENDDAHIIGGMLTAIKSFVETSFSNDDPGELREIEHSKSTIRIDSAIYSYLAVVYNGIPPEDFSKSVRELHENIHGRFYRKLRDHDGDNSHLKEIEQPLKSYLEVTQNS